MVVVCWQNKNIKDKYLIIALWIKNKQEDCDDMPWLAHEQSYSTETTSWSSCVVALVVL